MHKAWIGSLAQNKPTEGRKIGKKRTMRSKGTGKKSLNVDMIMERKIKTS